MSDATEDADGLTIVLSPAQLAAVLQRETLSQASSMMNRVSGSLSVLGGAIELAMGSALVLTPEPTMLTKVGGAVLLVHGSDTASTGLQELWTGRRFITLTEHSAAVAARLAGVSPQNADRFGVAVDILVPIVVAGVLAAARVLAVRGGLISLKAEEAAGGHTIREHVGRTDAQLRIRLAKQAKIPAATSFRALDEAEAAVSSVLRLRSAEIAAWASGAPTGSRKAFEAALGKVVGGGVVRATGQFTAMTSVRIVLKKVAQNDRVYFVLTAFPIP